MFQGSLKGVLSKFQECFKEVSGIFQGCLEKVLSLSKIKGDLKKF